MHPRLPGIIRSFRLALARVNPCRFYYPPVSLVVIQHRPAVFERLRARKPKLPSPIHRPYTAPGHLFDSILGPGFYA
jgi:hypothetical protein